MKNKTNEVIEGLLYYRANQEVLRECLEIAKLDLDRELLPIPHLEMEFLERFKKPQFLIIVDKLLYVFIFGEVEKNKIHYLSIVGNETVYNFNRIETVRNEIMAKVREDFNLYLPLTFYRKVIVIQPKGNTLTDEDVICLTRNELSNPMTTKTTWSTKRENYNVERSGFDMYLTSLLDTLLKDIKNMAKERT